MTPTQLAALALCCAALAGCGKKKPVETVEPAPPVVTQAAPAPAAEPTAEERERAEKQAKLDYATMEDKYINDPRAQWASSAKASSTYGDDNGKTPSDSNVAGNTTGPADGKRWSNNHQDIGFDTLELGYAKPVDATEVRVVVPGGCVEAISKIELQGVDGAWTTAWSGLSDIKEDKRGSRTWFVRTFDKTAGKVNGVRVTFANNVFIGYKEVDAVQLVGD